MNPLCQSGCSPFPITGEPMDSALMIVQSEKVYNFQRSFNLRLGHGRGSEDYPPCRSMGPVFEDEYLARGERYDKLMKEKIGVDPAGKSVKEKVAITMKWRYEQYDSLIDAVFKRRMAGKA